MKLTEAIKIVSDSCYRGVTTFDQDFKDAQKLLIEAGIAIQAIRDGTPRRNFSLLPRETPEDTSQEKTSLSFYKPLISKRKGG